MRGILLSILLGFSAYGEVTHIVPCSPNIAEGDVCLVRVNDLHPTQFAVGAIAVQDRVSKFSKFSKKELKDYLEKHPIPVVIGPSGEFFLIDHHHQSLALMQIGKEVAIAKIVRGGEKWHPRAGEPANFWRFMFEKQWVYLRDENGKGPLDPRLLPSSLKLLKDDLYRSLAWAAREEDCFEKTDVPFAEFQWAQYFRNRVANLGRTKSAFRKMLDHALELCSDSEAARLPGYKR